MSLISVADLLKDYEFPPEPIRDTNPGGQPLTWDDLAARDARLAPLRRRVEAVRDTGREFCAHHWWFGRVGFKSDLCNIIGWHSNNEDAALRTSDAYEVAYHTLYELLPNCRHEGMCWKGRR